MSKEKVEVTIVLRVKFIPDISWWDALKLRLAGGHAIRETIEQTTKQMEKEIGEFKK